MKSTLTKLLLFTTYAFTAIEGKAQTTGIVLDMETYEPVANAKIYTNTNKTITTSSKGFYIISVPYSSVTISHNGYVNRTLNKTEMKDTTWLLPKSITLNEVVIKAKAPTITFNIRNSVLKATEGAAPVSSGVGFDFFSLFKRNKVSAKEREKRRKAIENY